jgi:hypothetical protein
MWAAGFDPGGQSNFGWCVGLVTASLPIEISASGTTDNAEDAIVAAWQSLPFGLEGDPPRSQDLHGPMTAPLRGQTGEWNGLQRDLESVHGGLAPELT